MLIAANIAGVLEAASGLRPAGGVGAVGALGGGRMGPSAGSTWGQSWGQWSGQSSGQSSRQSSLGEPGADAAMAGFSRTLRARAAELDGLVDRAAAVLAVYALNFDRAGG